MRKIYVCSALRGDIASNIEKARCYSRYITNEFGDIPIAPHIYFTQFLDDNNDDEREFGIRAGLSLLSLCQELWYFGDTVTSGMNQEIRFAMSNHIPVKFIPEYKYENYLKEEPKFEIN